MHTLPETLLHIPKGCLHIWLADLDLYSNTYLQFEALLSHEERDRANRFRFETDKKKFIIRRGYLRLLLEKYIQIPASSFQFNYNPFGKPYLKDYDNFHFNLSHSGGKAIYAMALFHPVGVDIEFMDPGLDYLPLAHQFFSKLECETLLLLPASRQRQAFFNYWARKEAVIKAAGMGLTIPLHKVEVSSGFDQIQLVLENSPPEQWFVQSLQVSPFFAGAVATCAKIEEIIVRPMEDL